MPTPRSASRALQSPALVQGFWLIMDSILVSKPVVPSPGLFLQPAGGIKGSQCKLGVGHAANFCKIYYPRKPTSYAAKRSTNHSRVLNEIRCDEKILVANRGEIGVRVIRTAHEMGIPCVAVHSTIDRDALHVRLSDDAVCIGEALAVNSYMESILLDQMQVVLLPVDRVMI
ncbi:biotin carboxylase 1, chloroplastic-like isoform X2 [Zingiber officinale]|uniref:biotin carboxylase 1, chloroplastic-like isoform X2 n=1 Tax=Zingiber officinale TaxID=94328 RepID=UPI001C4CCDF7|nr:biotin carboxylase 1, chloroplastic-like isoform X2 [Zingiber officinale]